MYSREIPIDKNVQVEVNGMEVKIKGPRGEAKRIFKVTYPIKIEINDEKIIVSCDSERRKQKALVGTIAAHIKNMMEDVVHGYYAKLKVVYMHFPVKLEKKDKKLIIKNFLGEKTIREIEPAGNSEIKIENEVIIVEGCDREDVMQTANRIEQSCRITGYDRRVFLDGIYIIESGKIS